MPNAAQLSTVGRAVPPVTARACRQLPVPASARASVRACSPSRARNAQVGPGAGDDAGQRAAPLAGGQGVGEVGRQRQGGRLQVVAQPAGQQPRIAAGDRRPAPRSPPARRPGRRPPEPVRRRRAALAVQFGVDGRRGQAAVGHRQHPAEAGRACDRAQPLAAAGADRRAAEQREGHVAAQPGCQRRQLAGRQAQPPQPVAGQQRGGGVGRAAGQAGRHRDVLVDAQLDPGRDAGVLGQQLGRLPGEVAPVGGQPRALRRPQRSAPATSAGAAVSTSNRSSAWNTVAISWKPSARSGPTASCRLILAGTRTLTRPAVWDTAAMLVRAGGARSARRPAGRVTGG